MNPTGRLLLGAVSAGALVSGAPAWACSVCGCGDPLLSANDPAAVNGRLRLQVDTEYLSVKSGAPLPVTLPNTPVTAVAKGLLNKPVFETTSITTGSASLARDDGVSAWVVFGKSPGINLQAGYTRSMEYDLDTLFFGIGFNIRKAVAGF